MKHFLILLLLLVVSLSTPANVFGKKAQTFTDWEAFISAAGTITVIDFEGIALQGGEVGAVELAGNEFSHIIITPGYEDGLFVGIPDSLLTRINNANFFADDFFPTSGEAVLSPDLYKPGSSPHGTFVVDFSFQTGAVGTHFLDVESGISSIEAFDGQGGTGKSLAKVTLQYEGDNSQTFAGIVTDGIRSAVIVMGNTRDGVGIDDLVFGAYPTLGPSSNIVLSSAKVDWDKGKISLDGELTLPQSESYPDMTGEVYIYLSDGLTIEDSVIFDIKGRNYDMWEFENRHAMGVTKYKVQWRESDTDKTAEITIEANFDPELYDLEDFTPTLDLRITLGELVFPAFTIAMEDWTWVHDKKGNKSSLYVQ